MFKPLHGLHPLLLTALVIDLLTPLFIWKGVLPSSVRWLSHGAITLMVGVVLLHVLRFGRTPVLLLALVCLAAVSTTVALVNGQSWLVTAWGGWFMFEFPLVGVFAYLQRKWPTNFATTLTNACFAVLVMQLVVQLAQYFLGQPPGDDLAGTFGQHGTGILFLFLVLTICFCLGRYLNDGKGLLYVAAFAIAAVSSTLGELKMFIPAAVMLGALSMAMIAIRDRQVGRIVVQGIVLAASVVGFFLLYDSVVVASGRPSRLGSYFEEQKRSQYHDTLHKGRSHDGTITYEMGRNYAVAYGWNTIARDTVTMLVGFGLGARRESESFQIKGLGLTQEGRGLAVGTSATVLLQEFGLLGVALLVVVMVSIGFTLIAQIRQHPGSKVNELRYGLLLFSTLWPVWIWYNLALTMRAPMLIYFMALGYVLSLPEDRAQAEDGALLERDSVDLPHVHSLSIHTRHAATPNPQD